MWVRAQGATRHRKILAWGSFLFIYFLYCYTIQDFNFLLLLIFIFNLFINIFSQSVACGDAHTVCYTASGKIFAWGQCSTTGKVTTIPYQVPWEATSGVRQIQCGAWMTVALTDAGEVRKKREKEGKRIEKSGKIFAWGQCSTTQQSLIQFLGRLPLACARFSVVRG